MDTLNALVIGGNGAIGAALIRQYQRWAQENDQGLQVYATYNRQRPQASAGVQWLKLDLRDLAAIKGLAEWLQDIDALHHWVCCSGYLHGDFGSPEKALKDLQGDKLLDDLAVNSVGPLAAFQASIVALRRAQFAKVAFLSAQVGSIDDNRSGGWYGYRMSKAALNMGIRCAAIECARWRRPPVIVALHPGTTTSALSQPFTARRNPPPQSADQCAQDLLQRMLALTVAETGTFQRLNGSAIPW